MSPKGQEYLISAIVSLVIEKSSICLYRKKGIVGDISNMAGVQIPLTALIIDRSVETRATDSGLNPWFSQFFLSVNQIEIRAVLRESTALSVKYQLTFRTGREIF
jgi:hypothetical protein